MNQRTLNRCIEIAKAMAPQNLEHRCSHVTFLIGKGGRICYIGTNGSKTHPKMLEYDYDNYNDRKCRIHSEFRTILKASVKEKTEDLSHFSIMNLRVDRKDTLNMGRPCSGCMSIIRQMGIRDVFYSNREGGISYERV